MPGFVMSWTWQLLAFALLTAATPGAAGPLPSTTVLPPDHIDKEVQALEAVAASRELSDRSSRTPQDISAREPKLLAEAREPKLLAEAREPKLLIEGRQPKLLKRDKERRKTLDRDASELAWKKWLQSPENKHPGAPPRRITPKSVFIAPNNCPEGRKIGDDCIEIHRVGMEALEPYILHDLNSKSELVGDGGVVYDYDEPTGDAGPLQLPLGPDFAAAASQNVITTITANEKKDAERRPGELEAELERLKLEPAQLVAVMVSPALGEHVTPPHQQPEREHGSSDKPKREQYPLEETEREHNPPDMPKRDHDSPDEPKREHNSPEEPKREQNSPEEPKLGHQPSEEPKQEHYLSEQPTREHDSSEESKPGHQPSEEPMREHDTPDEPKRHHEHPDEPERQSFEDHGQKEVIFGAVSEDTQATTDRQDSTSTARTAPKPEAEYADIGDAVRLISRYAEVTTDDSFKGDRLPEDGPLGTRTRQQHRRRPPSIYADRLAEHVVRPRPPPDYPFRHVQEYWSHPPRFQGPYARVNPRRHHHAYPRRPSDSTDLYRLLALRPWYGGDAAADR